MKNIELNKKFNLNVENIILMLYCISLTLGMFENSTFPHRGFFILRFVIIAALFVISFLTTNFNWYKLIFLLLGLVFTFKGMMNYPKQEIEFFYIIILAYSMSRISPKKILKWSTLTMSGIVLILVSCAKLGIIQNSVSFRNGIARQALGTNYALTLGSYIFFICAAILLLCNSNNKKYNMLLAVVFFLIAGIVNKITGARNFVVAIICLAVILLIPQNFLKRVNKIVFNVVIVILLVICIMSAFITKIIPYYSNLYHFLDTLLSNRLSLQYLLLNFYSPKLLGQFIAQSTDPQSYYFFIDNSYARLLFFAGILYTILFFIVIGNLLFKFNKSKMYILTLVFIVILMTGLVQGSMISTSANIFIPLLCIGQKSFKEDFCRYDLR